MAHPHKMPGIPMRVRLRETSASVPAADIASMPRNTGIANAASRPARAVMPTAIHPKNEPHVRGLFMVASASPHSRRDHEVALELVGVGAADRAAVLREPLTERDPTERGVA